MAISNTASIATIIVIVTAIAGQAQAKSASVGSVALVCDQIDDSTCVVIQNWNYTQDVTAFNYSHVMIIGSITCTGCMLDIASDWIEISGTVSAQTVVLTATSQLDLGGSILANGTGYPRLQGPGVGLTCCNGCGSGGGGHGGKGGASCKYNCSGGIVYDSMLDPSEFGSGGGEYSGQNLAGAGGGWIVLRTTALVFSGMNPEINANGQDAEWDLGAGAGGSILLDVATVSGMAVITANGGNAGPGGPGLMPGGAGGGGRIAAFGQGWRKDVFQVNGGVGGCPVSNGGKGSVDLG